MHQKIALFFILITTIPSLLCVENAVAQSTSIPSIPNFTLRYINTLEYKPATYGIDKYTGENITVNFERWIRHTGVEVTVQNQPFTPYEITVADKTFTVNLFFGIRSKGHFEDQWTQLSFKSDQIQDYTSGQTKYYLYPDSTPHDGYLDFQVQAYIGYFRPDPNVGSLLFSNMIFEGSESGWSSTQTVYSAHAAALYYIAPPDAQPQTSETPTTSTPTTTPTPSSAPIAPDTNSDSTDSITLPLTTFIVVTAALAAIIVTLSVLLYSRHRKTANISQ